MPATSTRVGIYGVGCDLPAMIRHNDWWPAECVAGWRRAASQTRDDNPAGVPASGPVRAAFERHASDPFHGAVARHVLAEGQVAADMEIAAGRRALAAAGLEPADIDLLICSSWLPDLQGTNTACTVHEALGLAPDALAFSIDSNFNGFHHQVTIAESFVRADRARRVLLIQSASASRFVSPRQPYSPWFGDGATAVVMGPVAPGFGLLASAHRIDGTVQGGLLVGVPGSEWFGEGRCVLYSERPERQRKVLASLCDAAADVIGSALADAGLSPSDVQFYAGHQGTVWYREVTQACSGLAGASYFDTFPATASIAAANVPMVLYEALERGLVRPGDVVVTHGGGNGGSWSALVFRWGREP